MEENKSILHELYVFSEWKPEPEYIQKSDNILPETISALWRWLWFFGPKKSLIDSVTAYKERQQKWHIALGDEGKVIAILSDNILEIRTKRSDYATIAARTTVSRDAYSQWRKLVWSPDCTFLAVAYGNGVVSFFDLTASNVFNIPTDCPKPGGLECTDNTHAVADVIFMPLQVKDNKWNWEVVIITYDGRLRGYLVSQTDGFKHRYSFRFAGGVAAAVHSAIHNTIYVAGVPRGNFKDRSSSLSAGITAWRNLNDHPYFKLSVVSDQPEAKLATQSFHLYIPFTAKNLVFVVRMQLSPDGSKLVCVHCNGDISVWRLPLLKLLYRYPLVTQPQHDRRNPLVKDDKPNKDATVYHTGDINWWSNEEIIVSRFSGAITVCDIQNMVNILGKKPEFFQGSPQVTRACDGSFMILECESNVLPAKKSRSDDSMEVVKVEEREGETEDTMLESSKELVKTVLYAITDMETFQPRPRRITVLARVYRLLCVRSTTPTELFSRKIESGSYAEALTLADTFNLDSDLVYQQQWRKNPVSTDAIQKYLSKVSKKIWAVHQCVDRLPETLPAAKELLQFGLELTNDEILKEINKERDENEITDPEDITLEDLNAYTSELLRCRHVMLFYKERLKLYEAILRCEKSSYVKDEYDRLRSNSIVHSAMEIAKEGRIEALNCLWPHIKTTPMQLAVLEKLPETINPLDYQPLLPIKQPLQWFEKKPPIKANPSDHENDWCRKEIFRSIWNSNWSEDSTPETETAEIPSGSDDISKWYDRRAREIEEKSGLVSHALTLITLATVGGGVEGLDELMFHLLTLDTLIYDINVEEVTLSQLEKMSTLEICTLLMKMSTPATFVSDLKQYVIPFLKRYEKLTKQTDACLIGLTNYLESISVDDLSYVLLVLQSPSEFELDVRTHLELAERCLMAHAATDQLDRACDLLRTVLHDSDGSISSSELVRRLREMERLVAGSGRLWVRGVRAPPRELRALRTQRRAAVALLARLARALARGDEKPTQQDWEKLLKDILELQSTLFDCVTKEECYEIYASSLLTSGDATSIKLASEVLTCESNSRRNSHLVNYTRSIELISNAAKEYFNSASSLTDPALELARCCLLLVKDDNSDIQQELDLISALQLLAAFGLTILPIQVRLCEDRMTLIEECLNADPNGYLASHKLLKLAKLLRIAGDDDQAREGAVLTAACARAAGAGAAGRAAAAGAARRLAALRHAPAAALLARVPDDAPARRLLLAAAAAYGAPRDLRAVLADRLRLELEELQQMGAALKEHNRLSERCPSTDDEFSDAITTPVIEKKDLVAPQQTETIKLPLFNYLLDTFQNKFTLSENKTSSPEVAEPSVHCQEFYHSLYPEHKVSSSYYQYDRFSLPDAIGGQSNIGQSVLKWFYIQNCLEDGNTIELETEVLRKCAEELVYRDTGASVSCLLRACAECAAVRSFVHTLGSRTAVCAALYGVLVRCNAPELRDHVYLAEPDQMARTTLLHKNGTEEQLDLIRECIDRLTGMSDVDALRQLGFTVNATLFNADEDYRREIIYRVARSPRREHLEAAVRAGGRAGLAPLDVWLQHAAAARHLSAPAPAPAALCDAAHAHHRIKETLWPVVNGDDHNALINFFTILKGVDDKPVMWGLTAAEHIKLLKKAKSASHELDYKLLLDQPSVENLSSHLLQIIKPENVGMITKFLRTLPPSFKLPLSVNAIYNMWLTKYFFSVPASGATNKKWMQQYRQCASYFNKLSKEDLVEFVANTCFSTEAIQRVPAGTRNLMIMQAVDYCQQEQENDFKFNKNEQSWSQVGQELARWARFLDNYHSGTVQALVAASGLPRHRIWPELEQSHGDGDKVLECASRVVVRGELKAAALGALLQCLHAPCGVVEVLQHAAGTLNDARDIEILVSRVVQYNKEGVKLPEDLIDTVMSKANECGLPPHRLIGLLALSTRGRPQDADDVTKIAKYSADLFKNEWKDSDYAQELSYENLLSDEGRREAFKIFLTLSDNWQKKKALVDVLNCWPTARNSEEKSLYCEYLHSLLTNSGDHKENLALIKLLLRRPVLTEEEVTWLTDTVTGEAVINAVWIVLLNKSEHSRDKILNLVLKHKEYVQKQEIEEDLIKELLDNEMFLNLVSTPLYSSMINYIINIDSPNEEISANIYTIKWATDELIKANHLAEAGHLHLMATGVPSALRGFSQSVMYCKNLLNKN